MPVDDVLVQIGWNYFLFCRGGQHLFRVQQTKIIFSIQNGYDIFCCPGGKFDKYRFAPIIG